MSNKKKLGIPEAKLECALMNFLAYLDINEVKLVDRYGNTLSGGEAIENYFKTIN